MFCLNPLPVCNEYISKLNESLKSFNLPKLTITQCVFLSACITGIIITNSVCWAKFERSSFGRFCAENISKMFRRSLICWESLLYASTVQLFKDYNISRGILALDDTDNKRCKRTKNIFGAHKIKDKSSGGFINGQELLLLVLITEKITIPVGFNFYTPDPDFKEWKKQNKILIQKKFSKKIDHQNQVKIRIIQQNRWLH